MNRPRLRRSLAPAAPTLLAACALFTLSLLPSAADASAPRAAKTEKGATLVVPDDQAKQGTVYYVLSGGKDGQITFVSDAPFEHITGTNNEVIGYAVLKPGDASNPPKLVAGEFHLPVKAFNTGIPMRNEHLQSARWLDAAAYPDVVFTLAEVRDVKLAKKEAAFTTYDMTLVGDMTVKATTKEMRIPARITLRPESAETKIRAAGDLLAIRCKYNVKLSDFGVQDQVVGAKVSDDLELDTALFLSTVSPEAPKPAAASAPAPAPK